MEYRRSLKEGETARIYPGTPLKEIRGLLLGLADRYISVDFYADPNDKEPSTLPPSDEHVLCRAGICKMNREGAFYLVDSRKPKKIDEQIANMKTGFRGKSTRHNSKIQYAEVSLITPSDVPHFGDALRRAEYAATS